MKQLPSYPVQKIRNQIIETLDRSTGVIIQAAPGSGKSTLVPLFLLNSPWRNGKTIFLLQPRRAAARAVALRLRDLAGSGAAIGWITRGDQSVPDSPDILVMTEGIFVQKIIENPELPECAAVILDEFHERSVQIDMSYVFLRESMEALRPDLRLLIMSATLNHAGLDTSSYPLLSAEGRQFPVDISYSPCLPGDDIAEHAADAAIQMLSATGGGILIFLPGEREIRKAETRLRSSPASEPEDISIHPLYSRLNPKEQQKALAPPVHGKRKIVIATNIAETSLTIEGISCVIDSGEQRMSVYDDSMEINRLVTRRISTASAIQRAGRAGRLGPGRALRLWHEHERLDDFHPPEIRVTELSSLLLSLAAWGQSDPDEYHWPDPPPSRLISDAQENLEAIGAVDVQGRITGLGKMIHSLPLEPRLAAMCISAYSKGGTALLKRAAVLSGIIEAGDPFTPDARRMYGTDLSFRVEILERMLKESGSNHTYSMEVQPGIFNEIRQEVSRILKSAAGFLSSGPAPSSPTEPVKSQPVKPQPGTEDISTAGLLLEAYPRRLARNTGDGTYVLVTGGSYTMNPGERLFSPEWIVAPVLHRSNTGGTIFLASHLPPQEIDALIHEQSSVKDELFHRNGTLSARRLRNIGKIQLASTPLNITLMDNLKEALIDLVNREGMGLFTWSRKARELQSRIQFVHDRNAGNDLSSEQWPNPSDDNLRRDSARWLPSFLPTHPDSGSLQRISMMSVLTSLIPWDAVPEFDTRIPETYELPSGSRRRLRYENGRVVLDARIQQLFGMLETPSIAGIALEIELLSPAGRPVQITSDMRNFWKHTYPQVRKELRGKYPKHFWPEDPYSAAATDRTRPR